jgi:hypothetical protein
MHFAISSHRNAALVTTVGRGAVVLSNTTLRRERASPAAYEYSQDRDTK